MGLVAIVLFLVAAGPARAEQAARLLALGDSLVAGYGLAAADSFPARLEAALRARGRAVRVINAGVSGDTNAGGLARLDWALAAKPQFAIVALGANDMLRGVDADETYRNLDAILGRLRAEGVKVLLAGMYASNNLGREYGARFNAVFPRLAEKHGVAFYRFFLAGVAFSATLNQPDGMHPNPRGVGVIVARMLPQVLALVDGE